MATYPCTLTNHRYAGQQRSLYLSLISGKDPVTRKLRLCPAHFVEMLDVASQYLDDVSDNGQMSMLCDHEGCGEPREFTISARFFPGGEEETQFAGDACKEHAYETLGQLGWNAAIWLYGES